MGFRGFWPFSLGFRPAFLPSRPYFRVCVSVAVFLMTETSSYPMRRLANMVMHDVRSVEVKSAKNLAEISFVSWAWIEPDALRRGPPLPRRGGLAALNLVTNRMLSMFSTISAPPMSRFMYR